MAGLELLSDQGYRLDGRKASELRKVQARMSVFAQADGSAYLEQGNTKALAVVYGPHETRGSRSKSLHDRAVINCQFSMATFSTAERKRRPHGDRKSSEMSLHLKQTFEAAVLTELYPRSQIDIYVKVSGRRLGKITALLCENRLQTLALVEWYSTMRRLLCALWTCYNMLACGGQAAGRSVPSAAGAEGRNGLELAFCQQAETSPVQMDARLHQDHLDALIEAAMTACKGLSKVLDGVVRQHLEEVSVLTRD
ncbi:hypothetical protein cypCar_00028448 [Cyprinus carpio]|nr:hypothetical protein cypCar_00028448 [Cyprinus carpio]